MAQNELPKIGNPKQFAFHQTFVKPISDSLAWKAKQLAPRQLAYNLMSSNGIGQAAMDYKFNLDFAKNPLTAGFANAFNSANGGGGSSTYGGTTSGGDEGGSPGVIRIVTENLKQGFDGLVKELRTIRQTIAALGRVSMATTSAGEKTSGKVSELVEIMRNVFGRKKFDDAESNLEGKSGANAQNQAGAATAAQGGILDTLFKGLGSFFKNKAALIGTTALLLRDKIFEVTKVIIGKITDGFKSVKLGEGLKKLIEPISRTVKWFSELFTDITRYITPVIEMAGRGKGALKMIPIVGQALAVILTVFDGLSGFVEEFKNTDGNLLDKIKAGFGGALKGIVKGILEIPKMIILGVKWLAEEALSILGFKEQAEQLKSIKFGKMFDNLIDGAFKVVIKTFKPENNAMVALGKLVVDVFKALIFKFIPGAKNLESVFPSIFGNGAEKTKKDLDEKSKALEDQKKTKEVNPVLNEENMAGPTMSVFEEMKQVAHGAVDRAGEVAAAAATGARQAMHTAGRITETATKEISAKARALLNTIADKESPDYNTLNGGEKFDDLSDHPRRKGKGGASTAAGRYQFVKATWDEQAKKLNLKDFSPQSQDKAAWNLAQERYKARTGRSLSADLESGTAIKWEALAPTWSSLPGGVEQTTSMKDVNERYKKHLATEQARDQKPAGVPRADAQAARMQEQTIEQAKRDARTRRPETVQTNVSAPTTVVNNNGAGAQRQARPSAQAERYNRWLKEQGPRP